MLVAPRAQVDDDDYIMDGGSADGSFDDAEPVHDVLDVVGSAPGDAGWARRPRAVRRKMIQDYSELAAEYRAHEPYAAAARGGPKLPCLLCGDALATRAFLPCSHACVCDGCMKARGMGPMKVNKALLMGGGGTTAAAASGAPGKGGSSYLTWDVCPLCIASVLAVVPCGTVQDAAVRNRVEDIMNTVAGPAQAAATAGAAPPVAAHAGSGPIAATLATAAAAGTASTVPKVPAAVLSAGDAFGPLGAGFGGAEGPVTNKFKVLFKRAGKMLSEHAATGGAARGPPTRSEMARALWDETSNVWLDAADWTWDEGMGDADDD